jgi:hypothetical protein
MEKIRTKIDGYVSAEVDTMFDPKAGGPNDAIANWNKNLTGTIKDLEKELDAAGNIELPGIGKVKISDFKFLKKDGTLDWEAANTDVNKPGTPGSIYAKNGELKVEMKALYSKVYGDNYMKENVDSWIKNQPPVPSEDLPQSARKKLGTFIPAGFNTFERPDEGSEGDEALIVTEED